jgi:hypothetical protein
VLQQPEGGELITSLPLLFGTPPHNWPFAGEYVSPTTSPPETVEQLTDLWLNAGELLAGYSDGQVAQGLRVLIDSSWSDYAFAINDQTVSDMARDRCLRAIIHVFSDVFAPRLALQSGKEQRPELDALDSLCYMWWDIFPFIHATCLEVMRDSLQLDSVECWQSALHGLGHWHTSYPDAVERIIDDFLAQHPSLSVDLRRRALQR